MENIKVEEIMKNYKQDEKSFTKTAKNTEYLKKLEDIKEKNIEINKLKLHIERLVEESETKDFQVDEEYQKRVKEEYQRQIKETEKELENQKEELKKLEDEKNEMLVNKKKSERQVREQICKNVNELQDKTRKELMTEKRSLDTQIEKKKLELAMKKFEISQFNYRYDENGVPTNGEDFKNLQEESIALNKDIKDLEKAIEKCENYREKLIYPFKMPPELPDDKIYISYEKTNEKETPQISEKEEKSTKTEMKEKIDKIKSDWDKANKDYRNIHLEPEDIIKENPVQSKKPQDKNVFEKANIIDEANKKLQEDNRNYSKNALINDYLKETPKVSRVKTKANISYIEILENSNTINYRDVEGKEETIGSIKDRKQKAELLKRLNISDMCKEISGGIFSNLNLRRKINPNIVLVLQEHPEQLKEYISSIQDKTKLPFELVHNLKDIGIWKKLKLNKFTKTEEKLGAKIIGKIFNKNQTLAEATKTNSVDKENMKKKEFVQKVENRDSHIEKEANKVLQEAENNRGKEVSKIMEDQNEK